jgi:hypothetical protein
MESAERTRAFPRKGDNMIKTRYTEQTGVLIGVTNAYNVTLKKNVHAWGHFDCNEAMPVHVGPWYKTKEEALSDHERYIKAAWLPLETSK